MFWAILAMIIIAYLIFHQPKKNSTTEHSSHSVSSYSYDDDEDEDYDYEDERQIKKSHYTTEHGKSTFEDNPYYDGPEIDDYERVERFAWMEENDPEDYEDMW